MTINGNKYTTSANVSENETPPTPPPTPPIGDPFRISPSVIAQLQRQLEDMKARRDEFAAQHTHSTSSIFDNLGSPIQHYDYYRFVQDMKTDQHINDVHHSPLLDVGQVENHARPPPPSTAEVLNAVLDLHLEHLNRLRRNTASAHAPPTPPPSSINSRNYTAEVLNRIRNMKMEHLLHWNLLHMDNDQENIDLNGSLDPSFCDIIPNTKE
ncbi:hypothetical protein PRIPAC_97336 [Pristionchus pacificus]|uniref:Uncharacterized protein n=1 Tax=Pristionchus pacificus TaxID=54126 RepID=A0A2A6CUN3_PRIPA|nr:hypothetical protein PRIPAC_97336 [Pristionchus pacificus]|eukprot:PDM81895.1 hypothetical protein PRIPAC_34049 [Pristionchus pacificus]